MQRTTSLLLATLMALGAAGCNVRDQPNYLIAPQINPMWFSKAQESQGLMFSPRFSRFDESDEAVAQRVIKLAHGDGRTLLLPPEGTIRRGFVPTHFEVNEAGAKAAGLVDDKGNAKLAEFAAQQAVKAGEALRNPFADQAKDKAVLARAEEVFVTFCAPCHGKTGMGDGPVSKRGVPGFPLASPDSPPVKNGYKDGHIYHIISHGRGMMSSYASQIRPDDRWKAVLWVRELQLRALGGAAAGSAQGAK